jgi:hypothetical protein
MIAHPENSLHHGWYYAVFISKYRRDTNCHVLHSELSVLHKMRMNAMGPVI